MFIVFIVLNLFALPDQDKVFIVTKNFDLTLIKKEIDECCKLGAFPIEVQPVHDGDSLAYCIRIFNGCHNGKFFDLTNLSFSNEHEISFFNSLFEYLKSLSRISMDEKCMSFFDPEEIMISKIVLKEQEDRDQIYAEEICGYLELDKEHSKFIESLIHNKFANLTRPQILDMRATKTE